MLTSHSIELPTSRLFIILNIRLVDKSLYWTPNLSTSHCIELPNCRPVTLYTCRPLDQWLQWLSTYRPVTIDLSICQAVGPTIIWQNMPTSPTSRFTDSLTWLFRLLDYRHVNKSIQWPIHRESVTLLSTSLPTCIYIISRRF